MNSVPGRAQNNFAKRLLQQESSHSSPAYEEYRMRLEAQLSNVEARARAVERVAKFSMVIGTILFAVGGSKVLGSFDPFDENATILSMVLSFLCAAAWIITAVSFAVYYSRFRVTAQRTRDELLFQAIRALQQDVHELRQGVEPAPPENQK